MVQDARAIECRVIGAGSIDRVLIDRRDFVLTAFDKGKIVDEFDRVKYLDSALLTKSKKTPDLYALFQIFLNGSVSLTLGRSLPMLEQNCEDTGASKTCKNEMVKKLFWTPEKLSVKSAQESVDAPIEIYGYMANNATFFRATRRPSKSGPRPSVTVLDYGAPFELIVGQAWPLDCKYSDP